METIGEEADGQEFDFEIDLSSFRNGGESSEFVSSGTKDPQHVQPKLPNREAPPPPPPRPSSRSSSFLESCSPPPQNESVELAKEQQASTLSQTDLYQKWDIHSEGKRTEIRRHSDIGAPPPPPSPKKHRKHKRNTLSTLLRGGPKPPKPEESFQRSRSETSPESSRREGRYTAEQHLSTEYMMPSSEHSSPQNNADEVLMPTIRSPESPSIQSNSSPRSSGPPRRGDNDNVRRTPETESNLESNSQRKSRSSKNEPSTQSKAETKTTNRMPERSSPKQRVSEHDTAGLVERLSTWEKRRKEAIERERRRQQEVEEEEIGQKFAPDLKLTEETNKRLLGGQHVPLVKRLHDWDERKKSHHEQQKKREEEEREQEELAVQHKYERSPSRKHKVKSKAKHSDALQHSPNAPKKLSPEQKAKLKDRQQANLQAFIERQKKAREEAEMRKKTPFVTGEKFTGKVTKPKEFKLSYLARQTEKEQQKEKEEAQKKETKSRPKRGTGKPNSEYYAYGKVVGTSTKAKGGKPSSPPSHSGVAWARYAAEVPVSLAADPEFGLIEDDPHSHSFKISVSSKQDSSLQDNQEKSGGTNVPPSVEGPSVAQSQSHDTSKEKHVGFTVTTDYPPENPLSHTQREKLGNRPPTPFVSQAKSVAPPTPAPPPPSTTASSQAGFSVPFGKALANDNFDDHTTDEEEANLRRLREEIQQVREELRREKAVGGEED